MEIPKFAIGDASADADELWVAHLEEPFVLAKVVPEGLLGFRLECWPEDVAQRVSSWELGQIVNQMAYHYGREVEELEGNPREWRYEFRATFKPPRFLLMDGVRKEWTGVIDTARLLLWVEAGYGLEPVEWWNGRKVTGEEMSDVHRFYKVGWEVQMKKEQTPGEGTRPTVPKAVSVWMAAIGSKGGKKGGAVKSNRKKKSGRLNAEKARKALAEKRKNDR